jgi:hypothetical protein
VLDKTNTASSVWADTAYRSKAHEDFLADNGFTSKIHRQKPKGRAMPLRTSRANAKKSAVRAGIAHVFADQKDRMNLFIRTIGLARAEMKIGMANLLFNIRRTVWLNSRTAPAQRRKRGLEGGNRPKKVKSRFALNDPATTPLATSKRPNQNR